MKKNIKTAAIAIITILCFSLTSIAFAAGSSSEGSAGNGRDTSGSTNSSLDSQNSPSTSGTTNTIENTYNQNTEKAETRNSEEAAKGNQGTGGESIEDSANDQKKTTTLDKENETGLGNSEHMLEQTKSTLKVQLELLKKEREALENQYQEAMRTKNQGLEQKLKIQLQLKEDAVNSANKEIKQVREQIRETIRNSYTEEEKDKLKQLELELKEQYKNIEVLPVDSIIAKGTMVKFDTPPVIKEGRTLIPVRALSEGFGANIAWDEAKQEVTIQKEQVRIVLKLGSNLAYVNGEEVKIDVPPEIMNKRTVVPLRFLIEKLGLSVEWDNEGQTIEIEGSQSGSVNE